LVVFISTLLFAYGYLFYLFFVAKNIAVQYHLNVKCCHLIWAALTVPLSIVSDHCDLRHMTLSNHSAAICNRMSPTL